MRLLIDLQGAQNGSRFRGIGRYVLALLSQLIAKKADDDEIVLLLNGSFPESERDIRSAFSQSLGPKAIRVWSPLVPASWDSQRNLPRRMASQAIREWAICAVKPDCVLVSSLFEGCGDNVVTSIPEAGGPPVAVIFYDLIPYLFPDQYLGNAILRGWYTEKMTHLRKADLLLAISHSSLQEAVTHLDIAESRVVNISSGIDAAQFRQPGAPWEQVARKFGVSGAYLLYTGAADPRKNLSSFLRAFSSLPDSVVFHISIVVVGQLTSRERAALRDIAKKFPRGCKQLIITGYVTDDELISFYRNALAFVFPSIHEGFGLPLLEAMAVGCPVIASNCSVFPEVVGVPEALFDPQSVESMASLIDKVIRNQDFREWLVSAQSERVALFSWETVAERAWGAVRDLAARSKSSSRYHSFIEKCDASDLIGAVAAQLKIAGASIRDFALAADCIEKSIIAMSEAEVSNRGVVLKPLSKAI